MTAPKPDAFISPATLARALEIGARLLAIAAAVEGAKIAHTNHNLANGREAFLDSALFEGLSVERDTLRDELREMG